MAKNKIVTTEMILAKKGVIEKTPEPFYSDLFGGEIVVENNHGRQFAELISSGCNDEMYANSRLIYENCPLFRDKELLKEYDVDDPYLLPKAVYGPHVVEFLQLGNHILGCYGYDQKTIVAIKKK